MRIAIITVYSQYTGPNMQLACEKWVIKIIQTYNPIIVHVSPHYHNECPTGSSSFSNQTIGWMCLFLGAINTISCEYLFSYICWEYYSNLTFKSVIFCMKYDHVYMYRPIIIYNFFFLFLAWFWGIGGGSHLFSHSSRQAHEIVKTLTTPQYINHLSIRRKFNP